MEAVPHAPPVVDLLTAQPFETMDDVLNTVTAAADEKGLRVWLPAKVLVAPGVLGSSVETDQLIQLCHECVSAADGENPPDLTAIAGTAASTEGGQELLASLRTKRALLQATVEFLWRSTNHGRLLRDTRLGFAILPTARPRRTLASDGNNPATSPQGEVHADTEHEGVRKLERVGEDGGICDGSRLAGSEGAAEEARAAKQTKERSKQVNKNTGIKELLQLEEELNRSPAPSVERDAKVNLLKYLQIETVNHYEEAYDGLFYELNKNGGLERLRKITPVRSKEKFLQPKVYNLQGCDAAARLGVEHQADAYLADAKLAKLRLDEIVKNVVENVDGYEVRYAEVKSRESTVRKAKKSYGGNVRRVADMARVAVVCQTPELLEQMFMGIVGHLQPQHVLRVSNGFNSDWMPSGYRDVKVNPIVSEHLCEIQLHLGSFFALKAGQHAVYEWARELNVTAAMEANHLFKNLSRDITKEMIRLARQDWCGTEYILPALHLAAGNYLQSQEGFNKALFEAEEKLLGLEENSEEWRRAVLAEAMARSRLGNSLRLQGKYMESKPLFQRSLAIKEKALGPEHPGVASSLDDLAGLLKSQGKYAESEPLYQRSLAIREKALGPKHPGVASSLNNLAVLFHSQGKYSESEPLYQRALAMNAKVLGPEHPNVAKSAGNLAVLFKSQGNYAEAGPLYQRALFIKEKTLGPEHPEVAVSLSNLAGLLKSQGKFTESEPLYQRSLAIRKKALGPEHPHVASSLNELAGLLHSQGKYSESEPLYERSLAICEKSLGPEHPEVASSLNNLAGLLYRQGNYNEAEARFQRALAIFENALGPEDPEVAVSLGNLAMVWTSQGNYAEAEPLFQRALAIREAALGPEHPEVATSANNLAVLFKTRGMYAESEPLYQRSLAINENAFGPEHPDVALSLSNLAGLLYSQYSKSKHGESERLFQRLLAIRKKTLGVEHPDVAISLDSLAGLLKSQGNSTEAEPLYRRSLAIREKALGPEHPDLVTPLNNLAMLLFNQEKYEEALLLFERALAIRTRILGESHADTITIRNNVEIAGQQVGQT